MDRCASASWCEWRCFWATALCRLSSCHSWSCGNEADTCPTNYFDPCERWKPVMTSRGCRNVQIHRSCWACRRNNHPKLCHETWHVWTDLGAHFDSSPPMCVHHFSGKVNHIYFFINHHTSASLQSKSVEAMTNLSPTFHPPFTAQSSRWSLRSVQRLRLTSSWGHDWPKPRSTMQETNMRNQLCSFQANGGTRPLMTSMTSIYTFSKVCISKDTSCFISCY